MCSMSDKQTRTKMPGACKVHNPSRKHIYIYIIEQIFLKVSAISVLKNTEIAERELNTAALCAKKKTRAGMSRKRKRASGHCPMLLGKKLIRSLFAYASSEAAGTLILAYSSASPTTIRENSRKPVPAGMR